MRLGSPIHILRTFDEAKAREFRPRAVITGDCLSGASACSDSNR